MLLKVALIKKNFLFLLLFFFFLFAYLILGVQRYNRFETGEDLAIYCQTIWHYSRLETPFVSIIIHTSILNQRFGPMMASLAPFFKVWPDARLLIGIQQILVVSGVIPLYLFSCRLFKKKYISLIFSFLYLYFIGIQSAIYADFHGAAISSAFLAFSIYFLETKNWKFYWLFCILAMFWKEDAPTYIFALGFYALTIKKEYKRGLITIVMSLLYFYSINNFLLPIINNQLPKIGSFGGKSSGILKLFFNSPLLFFRTFILPIEKLRNIFLTSFSFGFLPFFSPLYWFMDPINFLRFFSDSARYGLHFHYTATLTPILAFSALMVLKKIKRQSVQVFFLILAVIGTLYTNKPNLDPGFPTPPIAFIFKRAFYVLPPRNKDYDKILSLIPSDDSVAAQGPLLAHLCTREKIYIFPDFYEKANYVALTFTETPYPLASQEYETLKQKLLKDPEFEQLYLSYAGVLLKRRG